MPRWVHLLLLPIVFIGVSAAPALADKRVALVIGNSAYANVARLANPPNDAKLMAETLRSLGFDLIGDREQIDLDKASIDRAVQAFGVKLRGADVALFYYAGHGVQVRGENYLVPIDANPANEADVDFQMLDITLVLRQMAVSGTRLNLVILDACRNNPFGGRGLRDTGGGLAQMRAPEGTLISFATQPGNIALDGAGGNSPYTKALAQIMRKPGLGIFEAINEVGLSVKRATGGQQEPWFSSSPIDGAFFFSSPPVGAAPATSRSEDDVFWDRISGLKIAVLFEEFLRQFPDSRHAAEARARLDELNRGQVAVVAPPAGPQAAVPPTTTPAVVPAKPLPSAPQPPADPIGPSPTGLMSGHTNWLDIDDQPSALMRAGFSSPFGDAVIEALAAPVRSNNPQCLRSKGLDSAALADRIRHLFEQYGTRMFDTWLLGYNGNIFDTDFAQRAGAGAKTELSRLRADAAVQKVIHVEDTMKSYLLVAMMAENFRRYFLVKGTETGGAKQAFQKLSTEFAKRVDAIPEAVSDTPPPELEDFIARDRSPQVLRYAALMKIAREQSFTNAVDKTGRGRNLKLVDLLAGLDQDLLAICAVGVQ
jgi:hypothetical protein